MTCASLWRALALTPAEGSPQVSGASGRGHRYRRALASGSPQDEYARSWARGGDVTRCGGCASSAQSTWVVASRLIASVSPTVARGRGSPSSSTTAHRHCGRKERTSLRDAAGAMRVRTQNLGEAEHLGGRFPDGRERAVVPLSALGTVPQQAALRDGRGDAPHDLARRTPAGATQTDVGGVSALGGDEVADHRPITTSNHELLRRQSYGRRVLEPVHQDACDACCFGSSRDKYQKEGYR